MASLPRSLLLVTLACAGAGAFVAAAQWNGSHSAGMQPVVEAVAPVERTSPPESAKAAGAAPAAAGTLAAARPSVEPPRRQVLADRIHASATDAFALLSWLPPPAPPPVVVAPPPAPPARPTAPPLPFAFVGMVESGTPRPAVFLAMGEALLVVSAGELLDNGLYRVESLDASHIVLMHLPTQTVQSIDLTGASK